MSEVYSLMYKRMDWGKVIGGWGHQCLNGKPDWVLQCEEGLKRRSWRVGLLVLKCKPMSMIKAIVRIGSIRGC